jgi:hypothetical protein
MFHGTRIVFLCWRAGWKMFWRGSSCHNCLLSTHFLTSMTLITPKKLPVNGSNFLWEHEAVLLTARCRLVRHIATIVVAVTDPTFWNASSWWVAQELSRSTSRWSMILIETTSMNKRSKWLLVRSWLTRILNIRTRQCHFIHAEHTVFPWKPMDGGAYIDCITEPHTASQFPIWLLKN